MLKRKENPLRTSRKPSNLNDPNKQSWYRGIMGLISFSSILPLNIHSSIEEMARFTWMWPLIGGFIGVLVGMVGWLLSDVIFFPHIIAATLVYSFAISFTGFHHLDGLIDIGDALMAHGDSKRKIEIMRDSRIGTGGIVLFVMVALITVGSIYSLPPFSIFYALIISEIAAKLSLVSCCTISRPFNNGTGAYFIKAMNLPLLTLISALSLIIGFLVLNILGIVGILGGILGGLLMGLLARSKFEYATGDVLGTSNEIGRMIALLAIILAFIWI